MNLAKLVGDLGVFPLNATDHNALAASAKTIADSNLQQFSPEQLKEANDQIAGASNLYQALWGIWLTSFVLAGVVSLIDSVRDMLCLTSNLDLHRLFDPSSTHSSDATDHPQPTRSGHKDCQETV